jgi:conserved hypothetical transmembrane protein
MRQARAMSLGAAALGGEAGADKWSSVTIVSADYRCPRPHWPARGYAGRSCSHPFPDLRPMSRHAERAVERVMLASRWLLVPLYAALAVVLIAFAVRALLELLHIFTHLAGLTDAELVLAALGLIDLTLVGNLIVMVALSGYETFVSRIDTTEEMEKPGWLGKYDPGTIKLKVAASIVAISAIHLLQKYLHADVSERQLLVLTAVHLAFVVSALILAFVDKIAFSEHREPH